MTRFVHVRELKNEATSLLRDVEKGTTLIVTRRGKPVATVKPFNVRDLSGDRPAYPTSVYDWIRSRIESRQPHLKKRGPEQRKKDFDRITNKIKRGLRFKTWQEMDKAARGDRYGLTR